MLLVAVDTSGRYGSIALARAGADGSCQAIEVVPLEGGTFSAQLIPQIAALLEKHGVSKKDIGGFAVVSGPGSFTGLRVGLAAIKALAEALNRPIAAVSQLEVLAERSSQRGRVVAALDAGRGEVYAGTYAVGSGDPVCESEELVPLSELRQSADARVVTPDKSVADALNGQVPVEIVTRPQSDATAQFGWRKILAGKTVPPGDLEANYIRRSDAEIFSKSSS